MVARTRRAWRVLAATYAAGTAVLGGAVVLYLWKGIPIGNLTRDPANVLDFPFYYGAISSLGILLWGATATLCGFTALALDGAGVRSRFLYASAALSGLLLLDDLFLLHEIVFPQKLHLPELLVYGAYAAGGLLVFVWFRTVIWTTEYPLLLVAGGFLAVSLVADTATNDWPDASLKFLVEDGLKFFGIAGWFGYYARTCLGELRARAGTASEA